jgi:hypothetical protein
MMLMVSGGKDALEKSFISISIARSHGAGGRDDDAGEANDVNCDDVIGLRRVRFLPMTSAATPVSAAAEQQDQNDDNKDQFHGISPLMTMSSKKELPGWN